VCVCSLYLSSMQNVCAISYRHQNAVWLDHVFATLSHKRQIFGGKSFIEYKCPIYSKPTNAFWWNVFYYILIITGMFRSYCWPPGCRVYQYAKKIQDEHKVFPWLQTFITGKLRGIQTYFLPLFKLVSKKTSRVELHFEKKKLCLYST